MQFFKLRRPIDGKMKNTREAGPARDHHGRSRITVKQSIVRSPAVETRSFKSVGTNEECRARRLHTACIAKSDHRLQESVASLLHGENRDGTRDIQLPLQP